ncbi:MAG: NUDIX domain-containing protein [Candidatus Nitrosocosmicus sp.]
MSHNNTIVVTSIIENDNKILILKRSEKVKSFKHKWAGVSGFFENNEDLLSRALIEIYEEIKLNKEDLILKKILKQITITIENEKSITIQPFYFSSKTRDISTDWEHSEYKWIIKDQIKNYDTVPKLTEIVCECF